LLWVVVKGSFMFVKPDMVFPTVCPMYIFPQSGHVNLYTPDCLYLSCSVGVWDKCFHMLLLVWKATLMFVCLNSFVTKVVSLPVYVNVHQYLLLEVVCCVCGVWLIRGVWFCDIIRVCIKCFFLDGWVCKWNALLYSMFCMIFSSSRNSFVCRSYVFRRFCRNLTAAYLCFFL